MKIYFNLLSSLLLIILFSTSSCEKLLKGPGTSCDDAEMKLPEIEQDALFKGMIDPNVTTPPEDTVRFYPGETTGGNYIGQLERDLTQMKVRWTFEHNNVLVNPETGKFYEKGETENMPSYLFGFSKKFTNAIPDDQIGTGDIITSYQAVIFNKCGETNPITGHVRILNSGDVKQRLNELSEVARIGHIQAFYNNKIYLLFGRGGQENYSYDVTTRKLTPLSPINFSDYGFNLGNSDTKTGLERTLYGDRLGGPFTTYVQNGSKVYFAMPKETSFTDDILWEYNLETQQLSKLASINRIVYNGTGPSNPAISGIPSAGKMTMVGDKIYYFPLYKGGSIGQPYIAVFDLNTGEWSEEDMHVPYDLVPAKTYIGDFNFGARRYFQLFYAIDNQLKLVFEGNREVTYDLTTKELTVKNTDYKDVSIDARPTSGFVYKGAYYFLANSKLGSNASTAFRLYKKKKNGTVESAFPWTNTSYREGAQFTPVGNTMIYVGGASYRYWFGE